MPTTFFKFKQFTVYQEKCAMKVGTDGTLLGAWAAGGKRILDIGTGTGLIAMMMAQRFADAEVTGIDIDAGAAIQATENAEASPFANRIKIVQTALQEMDTEEYFDAIVCNPPFFENAMTCPDRQRTAARHTTALPFGELMRCAYKLLETSNGKFSLVIPSESRGRIEEEAVFTGFYLSRICPMITKAGIQPKRFLLEFTKTPRNIEQTELVLNSEECKKLTGDFYL